MTFLSPSPSLLRACRINWTCKWKQKWIGKSDLLRPLRLISDTHYIFKILTQPLYDIQLYICVLITFSFSSNLGSLWENQSGKELLPVLLNAKGQLWRNGHECMITHWSAPCVDHFNALRSAQLYFLHGRMVLNGQSNGQPLLIKSFHKNYLT